MTENFRCSLKADDDWIVNIASIGISRDIHFPGLYLIIHFQGCSLMCPGCSNPHMQAHVPSNLYTLGELYLLIGHCFSNCSGIEGAVFLGGEPIEQAISLLSLSRFIKDAGKRAVLFTGYTIDELNKMDCWDEISPLLSCAVTGPFHLREMTGQGIPSSGNQKVIDFCGEYSELNLFHREAAVSFDGSNIRIEGYPLTGVII